MIRWLRQTFCRHICGASPHWLLDTRGNKIGKVNLLTCIKCGHQTLAPIEETP